MHVKINTKANVARLAQLLVLPALNLGVEHPPPEPPPPDLRSDNYCFDINAMLECTPHKDRDAFAQQYIADKVTATNRPHPRLSGARPLLGFPGWQYHRTHVLPQLHHIVGAWWKIIYH
jgi:hypothetical protein